MLIEKGAGSPVLTTGAEMFTFLLFQPLYFAYITIATSTTVTKTMHAIHNASVILKVKA